VRKLAGENWDDDAWRLCEKDDNGNITREQFLAFVQYKNTGLDRKYSEGPSMCEAAAEGRVRTLQLQIEADEKDPNLSASAFAGKTPMTAAAFQGHADAVKFLCFKGADVNVQSDSGEAAAHAAAENEQPDALRFCIDAGADLAMRDCRGYTPLHVAAQAASYNCLRLLIEVGAPLNAQAVGTDWTTALGLAASDGQLQSLQILIDGGADLNAPSDRGGCTAAALAARHGRHDELRALLAAGADVCQGGHGVDHASGATPCHEAAKWGQETSLAIVMEHARRQATLGNARARDLVNQGDAKGFTPFYYAAERCQMQTCMMLIMKGADVRKASHDGSTPEIICLAERGEDCPVLALMRERAPALAAAAKERWEVAHPVPCESKPVKMPPRWEWAKKPEPVDFSVRGGRETEKARRRAKALARTKGGPRRVV
jgi:ankyrin repeat protein